MLVKKCQEEMAVPHPQTQNKQTSTWHLLANQKGACKCCSS